MIKIFGVTATTAIVWREKGYFRSIRTMMDGKRVLYNKADCVSVATEYVGYPSYKYVNSYEIKKLTSSYLKGSDFDRLRKMSKLPEPVKFGFNGVTYKWLKNDILKFLAPARIDILLEEVMFSDEFISLNEASDMIGRTKSCISKWDRKGLLDDFIFRQNGRYPRVKGVDFYNFVKEKEGLPRSDYLDLKGLCAVLKASREEVEICLSESIIPSPTKMGVTGNKPYWERSNLEPLDTIKSGLRDIQRREKSTVYISTVDVAKIFSVSVPTIYLWFEEGYLSGISMMKQGSHKKYWHRKKAIDLAKSKQGFPAEDYYSFKQVKDLSPYDTHYAFTKALDLGAFPQPCKMGVSGRTKLWSKIIVDEFLKRGIY